MKKLISIISVVAVCFLVLSGGIALKKENRIKKVKEGMSESEVTELLGTGEVDVSGLRMEGCPENAVKKSYKGNASLWYGRFEDSIVIWFSDGTVCGMKRVGL